MPLFILAVVGWLSWRTVWQDTQSEMLRAAESAAEYGKRTLESYSVAAGRVNDRLRGLSDVEIRKNEQGLNQEIKRISAELTQSELIYVIDRSGHALLVSNLFPAPRDRSLADRDYFRALSRSNSPLIHVSPTFTGRFDGKLLFSVSRRRQDTGNPRVPNSFDGVVVVSVSPFVLANGLRRLMSEPTDRMAFVTADGYGVSTTSGVLENGQPLPKVDRSAPFYGFAANGAESAAYLSKTAMPGSESLLAMHLIDGFPIYAISIRPYAEIVARWWRLMITQLAFGLPATLGLFLMSLRVMRDQKRLAAVNADLQRDNDLSSDRLVRAKRFGFVGTFEYDPVKGTIRRSPDYLSQAASGNAMTEEKLSEWLARLHPDDRHGAASELSEILANVDVIEYTQTYRILTAEGEVRWIAARGEISRDDSGRAIMLLGANVDVTPLRSTEMALAESDARLRMAREAVGIGAWEWRSAIRSLTCSNKMLELCGLNASSSIPILASLLARIHPDDRPALRDLARRVKRDGGSSCELRILRPRPESDPETVWLAVRATRVTSPEISHPFIMGIAYDISERKHAEELTTTMAHEVEHRAKNALAVVLSLLRMTKADSVDQFVNVMDGRVRALSETTALIGRGGWKGADLRDIVMSELAPFESKVASDGFGIDVSGPPVVVEIAAVQPLSMALHELATNAAKYGALSRPGGSLSVDWYVENERVHLVWRESGGPTILSSPQKSGFGSRLIKIMFEGQIGGTVEKQWEETGLICKMSFPISGQKAPFGETTVE